MATVMVAMVAFVSPAMAVEFSPLIVHSKLNQPLDATIRINHLEAAGQSALKVNLAPASAYRKAGVEYTGIDADIDIKTARNGDHATVFLTTRQPVRNLLVNFLLQVDAGNGPKVRKYTVMLNPASGGNPEPAVAASGPGHDTKPATRAHTNGGSTGTSSRSGSKYQVKQGDTLWSIASEHTPKGVRIEQTMVAIFRANPRAFDGNMNHLDMDSWLTIPAAATIRAVGLKVARASIQASSASHDASTMRSMRPAAVNPHEDNTAAAPVSGPDDTAAMFGRLSLPSDVPWPAKTVTSTVSGNSSTISENSGATTAPRMVDKKTGGVASASTVGAGPEASSVVPKGAGSFGKPE